jgi:hypothetical protein
MNMPIDQETALKSQLAIVVGLLVLSWIFDWEALIPIVTMLGVLFLLLPSFGKLVARGWLKLALFLGHWNGRILLSLVYFLFLTPIAFMYRLFQNKPSSESKTTNYIARNHRYSASDLEKMW